MLLEAIDLGVRFGGSVVLQGVSFRLAAGEAIAIVGANGSGKTTLLNAVSGFVPTTGIVRIRGHEAQRQPPWVRARLGVTRTLQRPREFSRLSPAENVWLARWAHRQPAKTSLVARTAQLLRAAVTPLRGGQVPGLASGSPKVDLAMRVQTERAFAVPGAVVMLDEPLAGQSSRWLQDLLVKVTHHKQEGGGVLVIEHNVEGILPVVDSVLVLERGRQRFMGSKANWLARTAERET